MCYVNSKEKSDIKINQPFKARELSCMYYICGKTSTVFHRWELNYHFLVSAKLGVRSRSFMITVHKVPHASNIN